MVLSILVTEVFILTAPRGKMHFIFSSVSSKIAVLKYLDMLMVTETKATGML